MMRPVLILSALIATLTGCATPSPGYLGTPRQDVAVDGMRFAVHVRATDAQVIRLDYVTRAGHGAVADRMMRAAQQASGCVPIPNSLRPLGGAGSAVAVVMLRCPA
ncbi:MAG: hypothetical protein ACK4IA_14085 [Paracoccus hibiscisoli]|uniref:hypothetical protein n=1 Tax=Paracoccus hibiscisoli TaxID=2023261 RepID=UPI00391C700B